MHRKQVERPTEDHVENIGASPQIVDGVLWQRVQDILTDPERTRRSPTLARTYELRGRTKCGVCCASMVGQTLKVKGKSYPYYRCRFVTPASVTSAVTDAMCALSTLRMGSGPRTRPCCRSRRSY